MNSNFAQYLEQCFEDTEIDTIKELFNNYGPVVVIVEKDNQFFLFHAADNEQEVFLVSSVKKETIVNWISTWQLKLLSKFIITKPNTTTTTTLERIT